MIAITGKSGQRLALFGLGDSGLVTAKALIAGGAEIVAFDDNPGRVSAANDVGIGTGDLRDAEFSKFDALVLSPGVPLTHPEPHWSVQMAREANVPIVGDVGLFDEERRHVMPECSFIAITGTNGKSTTTALIAHILASVGLDVQMGGNIGKAVLSLEPFGKDRHYVVECSSYQIDLAPALNPSIGILLNLTPDHLDRHGTMENYTEIKSSLVAGSDLAVIGVDDMHGQAIADKISSAGGSLIRIAAGKNLCEGVYSQGSMIMESVDGKSVAVANLASIPTLRGQHNAQNACASYATCSASGLDAKAIARGMASFPGLAHRMEIIGNIAKTLFVNDSKGTNADAAAMALGSFENIYWIAGGLAKDSGIESLGSFFYRIAKAYLIGDAASEFAATLGSQVEFEISGVMDVAVKNAAREASKSGKPAVVLLSPACASFDQFRNFEIRGEAFKGEVMKLKGLRVYGE